MAERKEPPWSTLEPVLGNLGSQRLEKLGPRKEFIKEGYFLPVWIIANVQETDEDQVWLSDVEVLNEFMDTESKELVDAMPMEVQLGEFYQVPGLGC